MENYRWPDLVDYYADWLRYRQWYLRTREQCADFASRTGHYVGAGTARVPQLTEAVPL